MRRVEAAEYALMDEAEDAMWWYRAVHSRLLTALADVLGAAPARVLDAGCGTGGLLRALGSALPALELSGLEFDPAAASRAAQKSGVPVAGGDVNRLPFRDGCFDAAVAVDVLCHRGVRENEALAELRRVLAPGGTLLLNLPAYAWLASIHDVRVHNARRYTAAGATQLLRAAGFEAVRARYWNSLLFPLMVAQRKLLARGAEAPSDVAPFPPWLDRTLRAADALERRLASLGLRFPVGGSVLVLASRP